MLDAPLTAFKLSMTPRVQGAASCITPCQSGIFLVMWLTINFESGLQNSICELASMNYNTWNKYASFEFCTYIESDILQI